MNWISLIALIVSIISLCLTAYKYWRDYKENQLKISVDLKIILFLPKEMYLN